MNGATLEAWMPGLRLLRLYDPAWLRNDLVAGLSVAAVAVPIGIAYAQLAGAAPVAGLYSCILPLVAYALFGSSRQLIVNPDSAACAILAATLAPLAAADSTRYPTLLVALTLLTGLLCVVAGVARLGVVANFLSRPILVGYLNGIAISIIVGQLGGMLGFKVAPTGFFRTMAEVVSRLGETHVSTLAIGLTLLIVLRVLHRLAPKVPAPLVAVALGIGAVYAMRLDRHGVAVVGAVPAGFPMPSLPSVTVDEVGPLALGACGIVFVSFCSMMTTARGFAAKNGYSIDPNRDLIALGAADLASGLSHGFVVSGADSRTAVADSAGGRTQVTSLVAALVMAVVLLFLTAPLAYLPTAALGAILVSSALGLFDFASLRRYYALGTPELRHSLVAMLGVMTVGVLPGILVAVGLALLKLLTLASRPHENVSRPAPRLLVYRFDAALLFFNVDHFKDRVRALIDGEDPKPEWVVFNAESSPLLDITGSEGLDALRDELAARGIVLAIARAHGLFRVALERTGVAVRIGAARIFPSVQAATQAFLESRLTSGPGLA